MFVRAISIIKLSWFNHIIKYEKYFQKEEFYEKMWNYNIIKLLYNYIKEEEIVANLYFIRYNNIVNYEFNKIII